MNSTALNRFIGGTPVAVGVRLFVVSLIVGALMVWQGIDPADLIFAFDRLLRHIWQLGFQLFGHFGRDLEMGAIVVIPVWLVLRLINWRRA